MNVYLKTGLWLVASLVSAVAVAHYTLPSPPTHLQVVQDRSANDNVVILPVAGCADPNVLRVTQSLRQHPEQWTLTHYELQHGMGWFDGPPLRIWISNEDYGLDFNVSDNRFNNDGMKYPFTDKCRAYLYSVTSQFEGLSAASEAEHRRATLERVIKGL